MRIRYWACILFMVLLSGCGVKKAFLAEEFEYKEAVFTDISVQSISYVDERRDVEDRALKIPSFSWPGKKDAVIPALSSQHKEVIWNEIKKHLAGEGIKSDFTVYVTKGEQKFEMKWNGEHEYTRFAVKLEISNSSGVKKLFGEAWLEVTSITASSDYMEQLYEKAIREAVHKCFLSLKEAE